MVCVLKISLSSQCFRLRKLKTTCRLFEFDYSIIVHLIVKPLSYIHINRDGYIYNSFYIRGKHIFVSLYKN